MKNLKTMTELKFNETTYLFKLLKTKPTYDGNGIVSKVGTVIINGVAEYYLEYSYSPNSELYGDRALYEIFNVDDDDKSIFQQYGEQGFPFYMVQSMVSHIMNQKKSK